MCIKSDIKSDFYLKINALLASFACFIVFYVHYRSKIFIIISIYV